MLASASLFLVIGSLYTSAPLAALGGVALSALMTAYIGFFPTAILLRRRKIELSWWVPPGDQPGGALTVDRPFSVHIALRNHGSRTLRVLAAELFGTAALELPAGLEASVAPGTQVEIAGEIRARAAGYQVLHGAVLTLGDALGLFEVRAYFPNPIAIKVFPRQSMGRGAAAVRPALGGQERIGVHPMRRRGLAGELREIREHSHGDPFKFIAWKATARRQKLMVRDLETEIVVTYQLLLDIGGSMRNASAGMSKLDVAIETAAALGHAALEGGDRVGLITFDARVYSELRPDDGRQHYLKLVDRLLETHNVVDEDLTDLTNGELVSAVARYLAHQEAIDVRVRRAPPLDDPAWGRIQAGPSGDLYDLDALGKVIGTLLKSMGQATATRSLAPAWWWSRVPIAPDSDPQMARLRLFCRLRGIELPYRAQHALGRRAAGLAEAVKRLQIAGRADVVILVSDLGGVLETADAAASALGQLRRAARHAACVAPIGARFLPPPESAIGRDVAAVLAREELDRIDHARRILLGHGIPVIELGPEDSPAGLLGRIRQRGPSRRVA